MQNTRPCRFVHAHYERTIFYNHTIITYKHHSYDLSARTGSRYATDKNDHSRSTRAGYKESSILSHINIHK